MYENIQHTVQDLQEILKSDTSINEQTYFELVGRYSTELKKILAVYFDSADKIGTQMRPFLNYYRQLQHYLVFIIRYPAILQVPHHSEILQTLSIIENQEELIKGLYTDLSKKQRNLLNGDFRKDLEDYLKLKLDKSQK